jgi:lipoprotein-releasing system permease protein
MNFELFIARRASMNSRQSFSGLIIRIAVTAVALSLAVMIVATAVISGFKEQIGEKIFGFWGHIHITSTQINRITGEAIPVIINQPFYPSLKQIESISYEDTRRFLGINMPGTVERQTNGGIKHIQVFALKPGIIKTRKEIEGIVLKGIGRDFDWSFFDQYLLQGKRLELPDSAASPGIIISKQTATRLELKVGDRFVFNFVQNGDALVRAFRVDGIYKTGLEEYDKKFALVDIRKVQELLSWNQSQVGGFEVFIENLSDMERFTDYIYLEKLPSDMYCESIREKFPAIFEWLALQDINEVVILVLMLIVGLINMVTALLILILERTNMIGILKALGHTNWGIRKIFLYHAAFIVILGLFWGNLLGIGFCLVQEHFQLIQLSEENYYLSYAPVNIKVLTLLWLNIGTLLVSLLFLIVPSWLVTRISPVRAIKFK